MYSLILIGLGRMGLRVAQRLCEQGERVRAFDQDETRRLRFAGNATAAATLEALLAEAPAPRAVFLFLPAGAAVEETLARLVPRLEAGDAVLDCGNGDWREAARHGRELREKGVGFLDIGVSGGVQGARHGACLTVGGDRDLFERLRPVLEKIAQPGGCGYVGPDGWGHLVKTVHNGIEYGCLQALAEGLHLLTRKQAADHVKIDLVKLCETWEHGSIIASRLLHDTAPALALLEEKKPSGRIGGGETGGWAQALGRELQVPTPALDAALATRRASQTRPDWASRLIAAIRNVFGEHDLG